MPRFEITSPDGKRFEVTAPDGATQEQVLSYAQSQFAKPPQEPPSTLAVAGNAAVKGAAGFADMFGNAPANAWNVGQAALAYGREALGDNEAFLKTHLFQPPNLAHRGMEAIGLIRPENEPQTAGQRLLDMGMQGAVGALGGPGGVLKSVATGAAAGTAGQVAKEVTGSDAAAVGIGLATPFALRGGGMGAHPSANPVRDATLKEGQQAGYVVPPTSVNPSFFNNRLESLAGKAAVGQEAAARNQAVTNALAARSLGLPSDTPITDAVLNQVRQQAAQPYRDVASLSPMAANALEKLKEARHEVSGHYRHAQMSGDPKALKEAKAWEQKADLYETAIEKMANRAGRQDLVQALADARRTIAKSYDIEKAMNVGDANVSAPIIGSQLDKAGVAAKSGELATIGKMANAFPQVMREGAKIPAAGVSGTDAAASALLGTMGYGAAGPVGLTAAALPLLRGPARALALSGPYQRFATTPGLQPQTLGDTSIQALLASRAIADQQGMHP